MSVRQLMDLSGKVALITGGSRGLGLQIAEALGEMGAAVAITARKPAELAEASDHLTRLGVKALPLVCDVSDPAAITPMVQELLDAWGQIDVLVNCAGATWGADAEDYPLEAWQKVINVNLTGNFLITQAVAKLSMIPRRKGRIVNVASICGLLGNDPKVMTAVAYNSSKGGVINMTRTLAAEWARYDITVNAIAPGFFPTKMTKGTIERVNCLLGRLGGDEDLKGVAVLLASDASAYMTGQVVVVDGGLSII